MSKSKIPFSRRLAIWRAYNKRCVYTSMPIEFHELHIDHIIPEGLKEGELRSLLDRLGLPMDFDLNSIENLVPSRCNINRMKSDRILNEGAIRFFLDLSVSKLKAVEEEEASIKRSIEKEDILLPIGAAIEEGFLSQTEVFSYINTLCNEGFFITIPLDFENLVVSGIVQPTHAAELMDNRLVHGNPDDPGFKLEDHEGNRITVYTCREFFTARSKGYRTTNNYGLKMEGFFSTTCGILIALSRATNPKVSFISSPRVGIHDIDILPVTFLPSMFEGDVEKLKKDAATGVTVKDYVALGLAKVIDISQHSLTLKYGTMKAILTEVLRADVDGDGVEDILLFYHNWAINGSFGHGGVRLISRMGQTELFVERSLADLDIL